VIAERLHRLGIVAAWSLGTVAALLITLAVGALIPSRPEIALVVSVAALALGVTAVQPAAIPLAAIGVLLVVQRVRFGNADLTLSDAALVTAFWPALVFARRGYSREMRVLLWLVVVFQMTTAFTVIANPYAANLLDWFRTFILVGGALVVGWAVGREGYARAGFSLLMITSGILAISTILQGLGQFAQEDFSAVYTSWPYPMHKNFIGTTLGSVAVIAYVHPRWMGWGKNAALSVFWLCTVAVLFSQSRQALIALGVTLVYIVVRRDPERSRSKIMLAATPPVVALVAITVRQQIESGNKFNSFSQRVTWFEDSLNVWQSNHLFGAGLRWWYTDRFPVRIQPPNAELEVLSTSGVVGLLGFMALMVGTLITLSKLDPSYGTLAVAIVLNRFVQGQFDIFWVSVGGSLPFLVVGVCLGARAFHDAERNPVELRPAAARVQVRGPHMRSAQIAPALGPGSGVAHHLERES